MADHTPGPWELHAETHGSNSLRICKPANNERGCIAVAEAEILGMLRLEAEANARLIAAAPELLSLLQRAAPYMKTVSRNDTGGYSDNDPALYEDILAAVAKAKGA